MGKKHAAFPARSGERRRVLAHAVGQTLGRSTSGVNGRRDVLQKNAAGADGLCCVAQRRMRGRKSAATSARRFPGSRQTSQQHRFHAGRGTAAACKQLASLCPAHPGLVRAIFSAPAGKRLKRARRAIVSKCAAQINARYRAFGGKRGTGRKACLFPNSGTRARSAANSAPFLGSRQLYGRTAFTPGAAQPQPANWQITCPIFPGFVCAIFSAPNVNVSLKARPCSNGSQRFAQTTTRGTAPSAAKRGAECNTRPLTNGNARAQSAASPPRCPACLGCSSVQPFTACARRGGAPLRCAGSSPRTQGNRPFPSTRSRRECRSVS